MRGILLAATPSYGLLRAPRWTSLRLRFVRLLSGSILGSVYIQHALTSSRPTLTSRLNSYLFLSQIKETISISRVLHRKKQPGRTRSYGCAL